MRGVRATAVIMTVVIVAEGVPLVLIGLAPNGPAKLAALLGWRAAAVSPLAWALAIIVAFA